MRINHNISSMITQGAGFRVRRDLNKSLERLSTGLRINRAADDAAGLSVSEQLRTQVRGSHVARRNSTDAIALLKIAEGALNEISDMMHRMRELAVQGANDTYTRTERAYMQQEYEALRDEIDRISQVTEYNGVRLFNKNTGIVGTLAAQEYEDGHYRRAGGLTPEIEGVANIGINPLAGIETIGQDDGSAETSDTSGGRVFTFQIGPNSANAVGTAATFGLYDSDHMLNIALPDMSVTSIFLQNGLKPQGVPPLLFWYDRLDANMKDHRANDDAVQLMRWTWDGMTSVWAQRPPAFGGDYVEFLTASESCEYTIALIDGHGDGATNVNEDAESQVKGFRRVNAVRSYVGSLINRLEHSVNNLDNSTHNMQSAESTIRDADFAQETSIFTKNQILSEASTAMLAQANLMPGAMLSLLS